MKSISKDIQLLRIDVERDTPFAHAWFTRPEGRETLLSMGNAPHEIEDSTLEMQREIMQEFIELERQNKQITRATVVDKVTIGVVWIELFENHGVKAPSVHIMIGNPDYRGSGIGLAVMQSAVHYVRDDLHFDTVYTRHLANNSAIAKVNKAIGFVCDGEEYTDENKLTWQNALLKMKD